MGKKKMIRNYDELAAQITQRELEILTTHCAPGLTSQDYREINYLSARDTVETHRKNMLGEIKREQHGSIIEDCLQERGWYKIIVIRQ